MAIIYGYDTDDLTDRQYHYFCKFKNTLFASSFLKYCVQMNRRKGKFENYEDDCNYLFMHREQAEKLGINLDEVYK